MSRNFQEYNQVGNNMLNTRKQLYICHQIIAYKSTHKNKECTKQDHDLCNLHKNYSTHESNYSELVQADKSTLSHWTKESNQKIII